MKRVSLFKNEVLLVRDVDCAFSLPARMKGLLGRDGLGKDRAMWIRPCSGIHTFLMKFEIDLVFLSGEMTVVKIETGVPGNRIVHGGPGSHSVIELESGWFPWRMLGLGDGVSFR